MNENEFRIALNDYYEKTKSHREGRKPAEKSINMYIKNLFKLHREVYGKELSDLEWVSDLDGISKYFDSMGRSVSTRRNYLTAVLICCRAINGISQEDYTNMEKLRDSHQEQYLSQPAMKSVKQKENMCEGSIIDNKVAEYEINVKINSKKTDLSSEDKKLLQLWMILRILRTYDFRNEVATFQMISKRNFNKLNEMKDNYVVKDTKTKKWFISANEYKTKSKYNEKITLVEDKKLNSDLNLFHKCNGFGTMFKSSFRSDNPMDNNTLSKLLLAWSKKELPPVVDENGVKRERNISTTLLAKILLSERYGQLKQDLKEDAKNRGHDPQVAMDVYIATPKELK
jgi:hypothetical protein